MRRIVLLISMAFIIAGGTVGILYQEGIGGIERKAKDVTEEQVLENLPSATAVENAAAAVETPEAEPEVTEEAEPEETTEEAKPEETEEAKADSESEKSGDPEKEEQAEAEAKALKEKKEAGAPYYKVKVKDDIGDLNLYDVAEGGTEFAMAPVGAEGYLIEKTDGHRNLVYIEGKIAYITKLYTEYTEIPTDEYPDELLDVTSADAGKDVSDRVKSSSSSSSSSSTSSDSSSSDSSDSDTSDSGN